MDTLALLLLIGGALYLMTGGQFLANVFPSNGTSPAIPVTPPSSSGVLSPSQIAQVAAGAGFTGPDLVTAVAVCLAESGGNPNAEADFGSQCCSYGLWQINSYWHPEFGPNWAMLYDPSTNAAAAFSVYTRAGNSFSPWTGTYPTGIYLKYLPTAQAAVG